MTSTAYERKTSVGVLAWYDYFTCTSFASSIRVKLDGGEGRGCWGPSHKSFPNESQKVSRVVHDMCMKSYNNHLTTFFRIKSVHFFCKLKVLQSKIRFMLGIGSFTLCCLWSNCYHFSWSLRSLFKGKQHLKFWSWLGDLERISKGES